jgi:hypothetical protein
MKFKRVEKMGELKVNRAKKAMAIFLVVFFVMSATAMTVSAKRHASMSSGYTSMGYGYTGSGMGYGYTGSGINVNVPVNVDITTVTQTAIQNNLAMVYGSGGLMNLGSIIGQTAVIH